MMRTEDFVHKISNCRPSVGYRMAPVRSVPRCLGTLAVYEVGTAG
jgi:hypothetical protein